MRMWVLWPVNWNSVFSQWESCSELPIFPTWVFFIIDVFPLILEKNRATSPPESQTYPFSLEPKAGLWKSERIQLFPLYLIEWFDVLIFFPTWQPNFFSDRSILRGVDWCSFHIDCWLHLFLTWRTPPLSICCTGWQTSLFVIWRYILCRPDDLFYLFSTWQPLSSFSDRQLHRVTDVPVLRTTIDQCRPDNLLHFSFTLQTIARVDQHPCPFLNDLITSSSLTNPPPLFSRHCSASVQCLPNIFFLLILIQRSLLPFFLCSLYSRRSFCSWAKLCSPKSFFDCRVCNYYSYITQ